jgi:predicted ribosomally synthesized peptide with nif11-like leader
MSATQYSEFMDKVRADRALRKKLRETKVAAVVALAKECGFDVQPADLAKDRNRDE